MFTASNGLELDPTNKRYRKFGKIGPIQFGHWHDLKEPISAKLMLHSSNSQGGNSPMLGKASTLDSKALTYNIYVLDSLENSYQVYDFLEYNVAKKALKVINETYGIPVADLVAEKLSENRRKRSMRR